MNAAQQRFAAAISAASGQVFGPEKAYLLEARLRPLMEEYSLNDYDAAMQSFSSHAEFRSRVVDAMATHETSFFRDPPIFEALTAQILPELAAHRNTPLSALELSIWSAGCSTGQEAYSIVMHLLNDGRIRPAEFHVTATDFAEETLRQAEAGFYTPFQVSRGLGEQNLARHFVAENGGYRVRPEVRKRISFLNHNLLSDDPPGRFDVVFFRNVSIYFAEELRKGIFECVIRSIKPDGALVLGASESLAGYVTGYVVRHFQKVYYYELKSSNITLF